MITITHLNQGARVHSSVLDDSDVTDWRNLHRYAVGFTKPNYPMPAIRYEVVRYEGESIYIDRLYDGYYIYWECVAAFHSN